MKTRSSGKQSAQTVIFFGLSLTVVGAVMTAAILLIAQLFWMGKQIEEITWQLPATIYAEPPSISEGRVASADWLLQYLQRLNYSETSATYPEPGQYAFARNGIVFRSRPLADEPTNPVLVTFDSGRIRSVLDMNSHLKIDHVTLEPTPMATLFGSEWEKRTLVNLKDLPKHVVEAVTAVEDRRFFQHSGVDIVSVGRALLNNVAGDGLFQGGSTITQQLVKNLYLSPEKTMRRKISEAAMAILMEAKYSKEEILEFYLNEIYLGQRGAVSIKGIGEASQLYFKKDARLLTVPEAAMIVGLIQAPGRYDPYKHPEKAKLRRNSVLLAMKEVGSLSAQDCEQYLNASLEIAEPDTKINRAPYFMTYVKRQLKNQFSTRALHQDDYRIISTLDYDMQLSAQQSLTEGLATIDKIRGRRDKKPIQGSLIAIEASTGKIRAFVGGRNFSGSQYDRLTQARRQPGSSFKPFVYAAALETAFEKQDRFYTTSSLVADEPWSMKIDKAVWQPKNYNGAYNGVVSLRTALAKSMNIATAKLAYDVGFYNIYQVARRMGFNHVKPYPSIALGAFEVSPYQLIQAYTAFANGGKMLELQAVSRVVSGEGDMVREREPQQSRVLHEETAYLITDMLKTVMRSGTGASVRQWGLHPVIAGKTGTTNDQKDAWFVGYTPDLICLVWVGYDDNTPIGMTGGQAALPIWSRFMKRIESRLPVRDFPRPHGIVEKMIDPYTGRLASEFCPEAVRELFIKGTEPLRECSEADHYLPIESFLGPEPRIQQARYTDYNYPNYDYAKISYDNDRYTYTNYSDSDYEEEGESVPETVDYSDVSFPEQDTDNTTEHLTQDKRQENLEYTPGYTDSVLNDYEVASTQELEETNLAEDSGESSPDPSTTPVYLAPQPKKKKVPVYTNKDIPEAESTSDLNLEEDDDQQ